MKDAVKVAYKKNETSNADVAIGDMVPQEAVYRTQLLMLLKSVLAENYKVDIEMSGPSSSNVDIVVTNEHGERVVVELMAHERDRDESCSGSIMEHLHRCKEKYLKIAGTKQVWLINFTTQRPDSEKGSIWPGEGNSTHMIHVWHNLEWTEAIISEQNKPCHTISLV